MNTPLLVLTQYVYAKKQDGGFYSGRIEGKESENMYSIAFPDYTRSTVDEKDLVWLGFHSLPPHIWPKSPLIHPVKFPKDDTEFHNGEIKREVDDLSSRIPESLRLLKNAKDWTRNEERMLSAEKFCSTERCRCTDDEVSRFESVSTREEKIHTGSTRSTVLRLNRKALSEEISQKQNEHETCSPTFDTRMAENECARYDEMKDRHFANTSHASTSPHPSPYIRHDPPYLNTPCLTPPSTPGSLPPPLFICNPYDTVGFGEMDTRKWIQMDRRDIGGGKRRRRDNMKKCRKVYGVDNRDLWCTQCKWKKACVRFQMGNYGQRHF